MLKSMSVNRCVCKGMCECGSACVCVCVCAYTSLGNALLTGMCTRSYVPSHAATRCCGTIVTYAGTRKQMLA